MFIEKDLLLRIPIVIVPSRIWKLLVMIDDGRSEKVQKFNRPAVWSRPKRVAILVTQDVYLDFFVRMTSSTLEFLFKVSKIQ